MITLLFLKNDFQHRYLHVQHWGLFIVVTGAPVEVLDINSEDAQKKNQEVSYHRYFQKWELTIQNGEHAQKKLLVKWIILLQIVKMYSANGISQHGMRFKKRRH